MKTIGRNIDDLITFHVAARENSFTKAAESLGLSKSMVSKQIGRLETYLETKLFHRTTRTLSISEEGKALLDYSQKILDLSDAAEKRLIEMTHGDSGIIRISTPMGLGTTFFASFFPEVSKLLPKVQFESNVSNENKSLTDGKIDFAIRANDDHDPDVIARYLGQIRDVVCVAPSFAKKANIGNDPQILANIQCILYSEPDWNIWTLSSDKQEVRIKVSGKYITNLYQTSLALSVAGQGVARLPYYVASKAISNGELIQLFPKYQITTHPLYLVYLRNEYLSKKLRMTKDAILRWFKSQPDFFMK